MKISTNENVVVDSNAGASSQFKITANATAFQILSSGLYSDKVRAVIRELSCNAYDSHIAAGKMDVPIKITLPTALGSTFTVSDEGTGLSHEQVEGLYTSYFSSDKRSSNAYTGGFGLGSKSPFAYTDNFSVAARQNGIENLYICHLNEEGAPSLTVVSKGNSTSKKDGVDVSFAVKPADLSQFQKKTMQVVQWFDVRPKLINATNESPVKEYVVDKPTYAIPARKHEVHNAVVKVANVIYPLDWKKLMIDDEISKILVEQGCIELRMPIGSVAIAASREELQYDPKTCSNLKRALKVVAHDLADTLIEMVSPTNKKTWSGATATKHLKDKLKDQMSYGLQALISESNNAKKVLVLDYLKNQSWSVPRVGDAEVRVAFLKRGASGKKMLQHGSYAQGKNTYRATFDFSEGSAIVVADAEYMNERLKTARAKGMLPQVLVFSGAKSAAAQVLEKAQECSAEMGGIPIIMGSTLPERDVNTKDGVSQSKTKVNFVQVEDRLVNYYNFETQNLEKKLFKDIPENGKYFAVKETNGSNSGFFNVGGSNLWNADGVDGFTKSLDGFSKAVNLLLSKNNAWETPRGLLLVNPVDVARLKLVEDGYVLWGCAISKALQDKKIEKALAAYASEFDTIAGNNSYYNRTLWYAILCECVTLSSSSVELIETLKAADIWDNVRGYMLATESTAKERDLIAKMQSKLEKCDLKAGIKMRDLNLMTQELLKKHPLLELLNKDSLKKEMSKRTPGIFSMFACALNVELVENS